MPIRLAQEHRRQTVGVELSALDQDLENVVVPGFRYVIGRFGIVGVGPALEQQPRQFWMLRDASRAVNRALPFRLWLMIRLEPPGVCAGASIEERSRRANEAFRFRVVQPEIPREAQVAERIPPVGTTL